MDAGFKGSSFGNGASFSSSTGNDKIFVDSEATKAEAERLRKEALEVYVVSIPKSSGAGLFQNELIVLAERMVDIYEQIQELIKASGEMLNNMGLSLEHADENASKNF